jgi:hypothetical protein
MMRPYALLLAAAIVVGLALAAVGRAPRTPARAAPSPTGVAPIEIALSIESDRIVPAACGVPVGSRVSLTLRNRTDRPVRPVLAGYDDRLAIGEIAPGGTWRGEFAADRPGDGFAWTVDGRPVGRFDVTGSHLVEGHR